jgi:hypothetical protein
MPTTRRRRAQEFREPLSRPMAVWLLTGSLAVAMEAREPESTGFGGGIAEILLDKHDHRARWAAYAADLCAEYTADHPGRRPWAWWKYAASEGRRQLAGAGRPVLEGYGRDAVASWREFRGLPVLLALDPADPPVFESEPACLRRLDLLPRDEVRRLELADFEPVAMVVCPDAFSPLGYAPRGEEPDDDDENAALDDEAAWPS